MTVSIVLCQPPTPFRLSLSDTQALINIWSYASTLTLSSWQESVNVVTQHGDNKRTLYSHHNTHTETVTHSDRDTHAHTYISTDTHPAVVSCNQPVRTRVSSASWKTRCGSGIYPHLRCSAQRLVGDDEQFFILSPSGALDLLSVVRCLLGP